jgi:large subunit ribosomal protein L17
MRHRKSGMKLNRTADERRALLRGLLIALVEHQAIKTTYAKAKFVQPEIEKLVALAREDTPHTRKLVLSKLANKDAMRLLFTYAPEKFGGRDGGFTRITRLGFRQGDAAEMALIELV